jgi:hypothetical protein
MASDTGIIQISAIMPMPLTDESDLERLRIKFHHLGRRLKRLTNRASQLATSFGLAASALAAKAPAIGTVNDPSASEKNISATKPMPIADAPGWRQQQIVAAQPFTSRNAPFRFEELVGTEVRSPQDQLLQTQKVDAYWKAHLSN